MTTTTDPALRELITTLQTTNELIRRHYSGGASVVVPDDIPDQTAIEPKSSMQLAANEAPRGRARWSSVEDADLLVLAKYYDDREIAKKLGRTPKAIEARRLALYFKRH